MTLRRRDLLKLAPAAALPIPAIGQDLRARTLRLVPSTDLVSLDPVLSTALVAVQHGYYVFDTLYSVNSRMQAQPQMAEGHQVSDDGRIWTIRLREGLRFHDGEPVLPRDCTASLDRWSRRDTFGRVYGAAVDGYDSPDDRTLRIRLKRPFPRLLEAIGKPHSSPAFIMPERIATASPNTSPITEIIGSGPYRFLPGEFNSGNLVAYARFAEYRPRSEAPEWTSGAKVAHFERIESAGHRRQVHGRRGPAAGRSGTGSKTSLLTWSRWRLATVASASRTPIRSAPCSCCASTMPPRHSTTPRCVASCCRWPSSRTTSPR